MPVTEQYSPRSATGTGLPDQEISVPDIWFGQSTVIVEVAGNSIGWDRVESGIRLTSTVASGVAISVYRETSLTQDKDFQTAGRMPATEVAEGFDRQILINQEVKDRSTFLPPNTTTQNKINTTVGFDANGDPVLRTATQESAHLGIASSVTAAQGFANTAEEQAGFANDERVLAEAAAVAAQSATQNVVGAVTPKDYGAFGDGASHPASDLYSTLTAAQAVYPRCTALTEEIDGLAIQKACDTDGRVFIADGTYRVNTTIQLFNKGQIIEGESMGATILNGAGLGAGVNMFQIKPDEQNSGRMPSTSVGANNFGEIKNLSVTGPGKTSTSKFLANDAAVGNLWQAEGWKINDIYILDFHTGIEFNSTAKTQVHGCLFKNCTKGLFYTKGTTATNNTHYATQVSFTSCTTGVHLDSGHLSLVIADTSDVDTVIDQDGGRLKVSGGQIEGATEVINVNDGKCIAENMRVLGYGSTVKIPFHASNRSAILVVNVGIPDDSDAVIHLHDNTCSALGFPDLGIYRFSDIPNDEIYQVKLWNNELVHLSPFGIRPGPNNYVLNQDSRGFINYHVNEANDVGDDLRTVISSGISTNSNTSNVFSNATSYAVGDHVKYQSGGTTYYFVCILAYTGGASSETDPALVVNSSSVPHFSTNDYARVSLIRKNNLTTTLHGSPQYVTGIEDVVLSEAHTGPRTVVLPSISSTKATTNNSHKVTIIDKGGDAGTNNITININGSNSFSDVDINGNPANNVNKINTDHGTATFVGNGTVWYRI